MWPEISDAHISRAHGRVNMAAYNYSDTMPLTKFIDFVNYGEMQGFIQEFVLGGGNFVSGEQWACEARLPRGVWGSSPRNFLRK